jgi:hypothetical protein
VGPIFTSSKFRGLAGGREGRSEIIVRKRDIIPSGDDVDDSSIVNPPRRVTWGGKIFVAEAEVVSTSSVVRGSGVDGSSQIEYPEAVEGGRRSAACDFDANMDVIPDEYATAIDKNTRTSRCESFGSVIVM